MPGARVALLYNTEDDVNHSEIANICRLSDQVWREGIPLEIITELHLNPTVLNDFDLVIVPGFRFNKDAVKNLKKYLENHGNLLLIGDNENTEGSQLSKL